MKYVKMFALAAVAAGALMAFIGAGTASAAVICSTTTGNEACPSGQKVPAGTIIDFSLTPETSANLQETAPPNGENKVLDTCKSSTVKGELTKPGGEVGALTATGKITELTWGSCTLPTKTILKGGLEVKRIAGTSNGTILADGKTEVTINTVFFGSCVYTVETGESIGDLTEGKTGTATPPIFHANAVAQKTSEGGVACPKTSFWTATYTMTEPKETTISISDS